jgi:3-hydroxyisobutyrate dehydrogenase
MFKDAGAKMIAVLEAQAIKCPVYLGTGALNLLLQTGSELSLGSLLKCYMP